MLQHQEHLFARTITQAAVNLALVLSGLALVSKAMVTSLRPRLCIEQRAGRML